MECSLIVNVFVFTFYVKMTEVFSFGLQFFSSITPLLLLLPAIWFCALGTINSFAIIIPMVTRHRFFRNDATTMTFAPKPVIIRSYILYLWNW